MIEEENRMPGEPGVFGSSRFFCPPFRERFLESSGEYPGEAALIKRRGGRLVSLWGSAEGSHALLYAAFSDAEGLLILRTPVTPNPLSFPSVAFIFPLASRLERTVRDLFGWDPEGLADGRPWIDHGQWSSPPLSGTRGERAPSRVSQVTEDYPFVRVEGEGVHEIPVGPVHAGIIEPGHFRFQVVGEKILRMEARLGYAHRGIRTLLRSLSPPEGARLASRVSGDSAVAYQIAYAQAVEIAAGTVPSDRALWIRSILLERERISNHLGDLGALGNDAGFGFGFVQFARLKEDFLRTNERIFGHRYLMDTILPGGISRDTSLQDAAIMRREAQKIKKDVLELKTIYDEHGGLQDRFAGTGRLDPMLAGQWGVGGLVGRASGQMVDLRHDHPVMPWDQERIPVTTSRRGDVYARVHGRFQEIRSSLSFLESILGNLPQGPCILPLVESGSDREGVGWVEGFRGEVLSWVRLGPDLRMVDVHFHDPSWFLWPALEMVVPGNLVADFPLINKSFNASYSGHDS